MPALDNAAGADDHLIRLAAAIGAVKFLSAVVESAHIVHQDGVADLGLNTGSFHKVINNQLAAFGQLVGRRLVGSIVGGSVCQAHVHGIGQAGGHRVDDNILRIGKVGEVLLLSLGFCLLTQGIGQFLLQVLRYQGEVDCGGGGVGSIGAAGLSLF